MTNESYDVLVPGGMCRAVQWVQSHPQQEEHCTECGRLLRTCTHYYSDGGELRLCPECAHREERTS